MSERGLHTIEDDLSETWVEDWAAVGLAELEALLAKHAAFLGFLETARTKQPRLRPSSRLAVRAPGPRSGPFRGLRAPTNP